MALSGLSEPSRGNLLVFDGDCAFCTTWVHRLERALPRFPESVPWQWIDLDLYGLTRDDVNRYVWFISPSKQFAGHLALSALLRMQPIGFLRFAGNLLATAPVSWAAAIGYHFVARYRHKLPGGTPACAMKPVA